MHVEKAAFHAIVDTLMLKNSMLRREMDRENG